MINHELIKASSAESSVDPSLTYRYLATTVTYSRSAYAYLSHCIQERFVDPKAFPSLNQAVSQHIRYANGGG